MSDFTPSQEQHEFLLDLRQRCYQFFVVNRHPVTGLIPDRVSFNGTYRSSYASSAGCGFALASYAAAARTGWGDRDEALAASRQLLHSLVHTAQHQNGFVYHFVDCGSGLRSPGSEASSIDTAIMTAGAMVAASEFSDDPQILELTNQLCDRTNWQWMLNGSNHLSMGWMPERGFLETRWDRFSELTLMVLIAIGARANAVPADCWQAWRREDVIFHDGQPFLSYPPLFVHQYPHAFFDFRNWSSPSGRSYWDNSVRAHLAQIRYMEELGKRYPDQFSHYGEDLWGLTSSDSACGYRDWGGPYRQDSFEPERGIDGTIVPSAAAGGLPMVPQQALRTLMHQKATYGDRVFGRYGFINAYNPRTHWYGRDVIGIDTGITLLMAENLVSGSTWNQFMQHDIAQRGFDNAGFRKA